jgi:cell division protein FtsQ
MIRDGSTRVPPRTVSTRSPLGADPTRLDSSSEPFAADARRPAPTARSRRSSLATDVRALPARLRARTLVLLTQTLSLRSRLGGRGRPERVDRPEIRAARLGATRPSGGPEIRASRLTAAPRASTAPPPTAAPRLSAEPQRPAPPRPPAPAAPAAGVRARFSALRPSLPPGSLRMPAGMRSLRPSLAGEALRLPSGLRLPAPGPRLQQLRRRVGAMRLRNKLTILLLVPLVVIGGWLLLRDSGLFSVDHVAISGLGADAQPIVSADLAAAAHRETTTDFSLGALRAAVAPYTVVGGIRAETHFPHGVTIEVIERHPVAHLQVGHHWFLLDAGGRVVTGAIGTGLAALRSDALPSAGRSHDAFVLMALRVLSDAPALLRARVVAVTIADGALTLYLHHGPKLIFGNGALPHAKWDAATAVMADPSARGASYIDVQVPSRPAAQVADPATTSTSTAAGATADAPSGAASTLTLIDPALVQPSTYTSG